ncbi:DDB1- and CUL4-associated factor 11-like isoform X2, partial [Leptotrombidium deliense]
MGLSVSRAFTARNRRDTREESTHESDRRTDRSVNATSQSNVMSQRNESDNELESEEQTEELSGVLQYLIRRGHVRLVYDVYVDDSDDDDDILTFTEDPKPDTSVIDESDFKQIIKLQSGLNVDYEKVPSFLHLLRRREYSSLGNKLGCRSAPCFRNSDKCIFGSNFLPNSSSVLEQYPSKAFCGFFSKDGSLFLTACQDCIIRLYDTRNGSFTLIKTVWARDVGWSILDTDISPDGRHFIYSSWSECIHICNIHGSDEVHESLPLLPSERRFCIFSLRFSQDGNEVLGGANDECLYVYDLNINERVLRIKSHDDDVNSVAFADKGSQILFSAGDDGMCKVWDRRTLNESNPKAVGIFAGHCDGVTYIDSKGDGRHLITNCKDQSIKLWDMRAFSPLTGFDATRKAVSKQNWDYRWQAVPRKLYNSRKKLEGDTSLMTYRGHSVQQTLIRCHFSPDAMTGQRYIYTGCASGRVVIYDSLSGKIVKLLNGHRGCVRDVSWHPQSLEIISTSWDGNVTKWYHVDESV